MLQTTFNRYPSNELAWKNGQPLTNTFSANNPTIAPPPPCIGESSSSPPPESHEQVPTHRQRETRVQPNEPSLPEDTFESRLPRQCRNRVRGPRFTFPGTAFLSLPPVCRVCHSMEIRKLIKLNN